MLMRTILEVKDIKFSKIKGHAVLGRQLGHRSEVPEAASPVL